MNWGQRWGQRDRKGAQQETLQLQVHAVRRIVDFSGAGAQYVIELTLVRAPEGCTAYGLALADDVQEARAVAARIWDDTLWIEADDTPLSDAVRLRMLVAMPEEAAGVWHLRAGTEVLGSVDLDGARPLAAPEVADPFEARGDCARCGSFTALSRSGHCRRCQTQAACLLHADRISAARCMGCRQAFCADCLANGHCPACRAAAAGQRHLTGPGRPATPIEATKRVFRGAVDAVKQRRRLLVGLVLAASLLKAGHLVYELNTAPVVELTDAQRQVRAMETVAGALGAMRGAGGLPKEAKEVAAFMAQAGINDAPAVIDAGKPLKAGAVVYKRAGETFVLHQVGQDGKLVMVGESPLTLTRGAE